MKARTRECFFLFRNKAFLMILQTKKPIGRPAALALQDEPRFHKTTAFLFEKQLF
jgi:hypothetical protein